MFGKPQHPTVAARATALGILLAMLLSYAAFHGAAIISGNHVLDLQLLRNLSLIGLLVIGYSWWENNH